jgi:soluble lytic murein transglycosylase
VKDPFRPDENVRGGTRYLRDMIDRYGDWSRALAAYNAGPSAVDQYRGVPPYPETRDYVMRVLNYYRHYDGDFGQ